MRSAWKRVGLVGVTIAGMSVGSVVMSPARAFANGTAPACITRAVGEDGFYGWAVSVANECGTTMRVRIVGTFGPFGCHTLKPGQVLMHKGTVGGYRRTEVC